MAWPQATDYREALQNPKLCLTDPELRQGEVAVNARGLPLLWVGNFAAVFKVHCPAMDATWAVKCFTREVAGLRERYQAISVHLDRVQLPFTVPFYFFDQGIKLHGQAYPVLKMRWIEGLALNEFVKEYLDKPRILEQLAKIWVRLAHLLRQGQVAHGDLQHGNVLLIARDKADTLGVRLVDYDGMHVPALAHNKSGEVGHPSYQHPQRLREGIYHPDIDHFSQLAIYGALRCLIAVGRSVWDKFDNGDNLLFRHRDFEAPKDSALFQELWRSSDANVHAVAGHLLWACQGTVHQVPRLHDLISEDLVLPLTPPQERHVGKLLGVDRDLIVAFPISARDTVLGKDPSARTEVSLPADNDKGAKESRKTPPPLPWQEQQDEVEQSQVGGKKLKPVLALAGLGLVILLATFLLIIGRQEQPKTSLPPAPQNNTAPQDHTASIEMPGPIARSKPAQVLPLIIPKNPPRPSMHVSNAKHAPFAWLHDGKLLSTDEKRQGRHIKAYMVRLNRDITYTIDLTSSWQNLLRVEDADGDIVPVVQIQEGGLKAPLVFTPNRDGDYRVIASSFRPGVTGSFALKIWPQPQTAHPVKPLMYAKKPPVKPPPMPQEVQVAEFEGFIGLRQGAVFSPDGKWFVRFGEIRKDHKTNALFRKAEIWDLLKTPWHPYFRELETDTDLCAAISTDGKLAYGGPEKKVVIFDLFSQKKHYLPGQHEGSVKCLAYSFEGKRFATASSEKIRFWDTAEERILSALSCPADKNSAPVVCLAFGPRRYTLAYGQWLSVVKAPGSGLWDPAKDPEGKDVKPATRHQATVSALTFSPDGKWLACGDRSGEVKVMNLLNNFEQFSFPLGTEPVAVIAFSPNTRFLVAAGTSDGLLWDWETGEEVLRLNPQIIGLAFSRKEKTVALFVEGPSLGATLNELRGDRERLQGSWVEQSNAPVKLKRLKPDTFTITFQDGTFTIESRDYLKGSGTFSLKRGKTKAIDMTWTKGKLSGKTFFGIYKLVDNSLWLQVRPTRPKSFTVPLKLTKKESNTPAAGVLPSSGTVGPGTVAAAAPVMPRTEGRPLRYSRGFQ